MTTGCGSLGVAVDVLDPGHVQQEMSDEGLRKLYREISVTQAEAFANRVDRQFNTFKQQVLLVTNEMMKLAPKLPTAEKQAIDASAKAANDGVNDGGIYRVEASKAGDKLERLAQDVRDAGARVGYVRSVPIPPDLREKLVAFQAEDRRLRVVKVRAVRNLKAAAENAARSATKPADGSPAAVAAATAKTVALAPALNAVATQADTGVNAIQRSIIQDGSLAATEYAYVVASAPEGAWKRDFNRAFASGTLGNVDMVIRLNSTADFSVKGLLFDASKVAQVASKVLTQSVLLGAQMAGVPIRTASPAGTAGTANANGGEALSQSSVELGTAEATLEKRQALEASQRNAIRSLARSMIAVTPALTDDALKNQPASNPARVQLHQGIQASFTSLRPLLEVQELQ